MCGDRGCRYLQVVCDRLVGGASSGQLHDLLLRMGQREPAADTSLAHDEVGGAAPVEVIDELPAPLEQAAPQPVDRCLAGLSVTERGGDARDVSQSRPRSVRRASFCRKLSPTPPRRHLAAIGPSGALLPANEPSIRIPRDTASARLSLRPAIVRLATRRTAGDAPGVPGRDWPPSPVPGAGLTPVPKIGRSGS